MAFDVFISHRWSTEGSHGGPGALTFSRALKQCLDARTIHGRPVRAFLDDENIGFGDGMSHEVLTALRETQIFVPVLSVDYFESLACSTELVEFLRQSFQADSFLHRLFPIDIAPENGQAHFKRTPLQWNLVPRVYGSDAANVPDQIADAIVLKLSDGATGEKSEFKAPELQLRGELFKDDLFVGRNLELLQVFQALLLDENRMANLHGGQVQIVGPPGQGKTLLAHQFVELFGSMFGGGCGVFDSQALFREDGENSLAVDAEVLEQNRPMAESRGDEDRGKHAVPAALWVLDNMRSDVTGEAVRALLGIPSTDKLVITKISSSDEMVRRIDLGPFSVEESVRVLTSGIDTRLSDEDFRRCGEIAESLDHYPLAVRLVAASIGRLARQHSGSPFEIVQGRLGDVASELEQIGSGVVLSGHESSVSRTVATLLPTLRSEVLAPLWLASFLAPESIARTSLHKAIGNAEANGVKFQHDYVERDLDDAIDQLVGAGVLNRSLNEPRVRPHRVIIAALQRLVSTIDFKVTTAIPDDPKFYVSLGSIDALRAAIQSDPHPGNRLHAAELKQRLTSLRPSSRGTQLDAMRAGGDLAIWLAEVGDFREAVSLQRDQASVANRLLGRNHPETLTAENNLAVNLGKVGNLEEARSLSESVLERRRSVLGETHEDTVMSANNLGTLLRESGHLKEASAEFERCVRAWKARGEEGSKHDLSTKGNWALVLLDLGQRDRAIALQTQVIQGFNSMYGVGDPRTLLARANLTTMLYAAGRYEDAYNEQNRLAEEQEALLGPTHPDVLMTRANLATSLSALGRDVEAVSLGTEVVRAREEIFGPRHPDTLTAKMNLGEAKCASGDFESGRALLKEVFEARMDILGPAHPATIAASSNLAGAAFNAGEIEVALAMQRETLDTASAALGDRNPITLGIKSNLAASLLSSNHPAEAEQLMIELMSLLEMELGKMHPNTLMARFNLANAQVALGRIDESLKSHESVLADRMLTLGPTHPETKNSQSSVAILAAAAQGALPPGLLNIGPHPR